MSRLLAPVVLPLAAAGLFPAHDASGSAQAPVVLPNPEPKVNALALVLQPFGDTLAPAFAGFAEELDDLGPGSFTSDDGWFYREYNAAGYLHFIVNPKDKDSGHEGADGHGSEYLRIEYGAEQSEEWGGFVDMGRILPDRNDVKVATDTPGHYLGYSAALYDCQDATHIRLTYRTVVPQSLPGRAHARLILLDDSDCVEVEGSESLGCAAAPGQQLENWYSFNYVLDDSSDGTWQELILPWTSFERPGWTGQVGNDVLDPEALRGWRLELSIDSQGEVGSASEGVVDLGSLSCVGPPDDDSALLGEPFRHGENFTAAIASGVWSERHYQSAVSKDLSSAHLFPETATLVVNYTVEQSEDWGGFIDFSHIAPGFYNLIDAEAISLDYEVLLPASEPGRAHLRLILLDGSNCTNDQNGQCDAYPGQSLENYYSFHYILDDHNSLLDEGKNTRGTIIVPLIGNSDPDSPFYRTGWTGVVGDDVLDKDSMRGFRLEINIDSAGEVGSLVSGMVALGNLTAIFPKQNLGNTISASINFESEGGDPSVEEQLLLQEAKCVVEPDLHFSIASPSFDRKIEFVGSRCGDICQADARCLFSHDTGRDCHLSDGLDSAAVELANTEFLRSTTASCWMDDPAKRGSFCSVCTCHEEQALIDCRGRNLTIAPKLFDQPWAPEVLDLRDNPSLLVLGQRTFQSISSTLNNIYLPKETLFISPQAFPGLSDSASITLEDEGQNVTIDQRAVVNFISDNIDPFGDVCCSVSSNTSGSLSFCNLEAFAPGVDSIYEPYFQYFEAVQLSEIRPSSPFMSEAAESPEMCAEYCTIENRCRFFSYDARWKESEHRCYLLENKGTRSEEICCAPDDHGDEGGTVPGWTSGWTPRTRYEDGAKVIFQPKELELSEEDGFEAFYEIRLGANPLRGAVWVEPTLLRTDGLKISIFPQRVVFYDANTTATIHVAADVAISESTTVLIINHKITSCDAAFMSVNSDDQANAEDVFVKVVQPPQNMQRNIIIALGSIFGGSMIVFIVYISYKRWKAYRAMKKAHEQQMESKLNQATRALYDLDYPLHLIRGEEFVQEGQLVQHETMRNNHRLSVLDNLSDVDAFIEAGHEVVFFSHQWTGFNEPDENKRQYRAMVHALKALAKRNGWDMQLRNVYVWVDYSCIPQSNLSVQGLAIRSLAVYASSATYFVVVAPDTPHTGFRNMCNLDTYQRRMWCRAEQVCHSMRNGTENMFLAVSNEKDDEFCSVKKDFFRESLRVFDGELTCCRMEHKGMGRCDRESLVVPILGLYGELFRAAHEGIKSECADMSTVEAFLREIDEHQDAVFPREFKRVMWKKKRKVIEDVVLFGDLIDRMRMRIKKGTYMFSTDSEDTESVRSDEFARRGSQETLIRHGSMVRHGRNSELARKGSQVFTRHGARRATLEIMEAETAVRNVNASCDISAAAKDGSYR